MHGAARDLETATRAPAPAYADTWPGIAPPPPPPPLKPPPPRPPGLPSLQQRVRASAAFWREIGAPPHVLRWIREGVRIDWLDGPPPPFDHGVSRTKPEHRAWITAECDRCLLTGAFCRASCFDFVSKAFIVEHNGKKRLVFNLKHLNDFCVKRACRFGSLSALRRTLHEGDLMWSIDLSDAYHHVGIYEPHQKYFTFAIETSRGVEYFSTGALNFGWCRSPQIFTEFMKPIVAYLRNPSPDQPAARVLPWLDDFMFSFSGSLAEATPVRDHSFSTLERCGVTRNATKGQPEPSTLLYDHLGYGIDSASMRFLLTAKRERKLRLRTSALLRSATRTRRLVRKRELVSLLGLAQSSDLALPLVRLWLRSAWDDAASRPGWTGCVRLSRQTRADLAHLTTLRGSKHVGRSIALLPDTAVAHVDAGPYGWGGRLQRGHPPQSGFWAPSEAVMHITWRELRAVRLFILRHLGELAGRRLLLHEDNTAVVAMVHSLTSRSPALMTELRLLVKLLSEHDISLRAQYIRSADNWDADYHSRLVRPHEYRIERAIFELLSARWGACSVDAFASEATAQLPRFWAESAGSSAEAVDAFAQPWDTEALIWAHPPPALIPQLVQLLESTPAASVIVCVPYWPGSPWFRPLADLAQEMLIFPPGSLQRVAFDAPALLAQWSVAAFHIQPR